MIYATDIGRPAVAAEPCKPSFGQRCSSTIARSFGYLAVTAAIFLAVGGAALAKLAL